MIRPRIALIALHLLGNALLLLLGYYWLGLGESDAPHLALSALVLVLFVLGTTWLHGTALILFNSNSDLPFSSMRSLRNLLPLFVLTLVVFSVYLVLGHFYDSFGHQAFNIGSYSTMKLRRPVEPNGVLKVFHGFIWLLRWFVVPAFAWPIATEVANRGWAGFNPIPSLKPRRILLWIEIGVLLLVAIYLPLHLFYWIPPVSSFSMEVVSAVCRLGLGHFLFTGALLLLEFLTSVGSPSRTQDSTAVSP